MPSKFFRCLVSALALFAASCTLQVNEPEMPAATIKVNPVEEGCLSNIGLVLNRYFDGAISHEELDSFWACLIKSFETFTENTKGEAGDYYRPQELAAFMERYFLAGRKVPSSFLREALKLKQGILGGSTDKITREELRATIGLMHVLRRETLRLRPHLPIGAEAVLNRSLSEQRFEQAMAALEESMTAIGRSLEGSIGSYSFDNMSSLVSEMGLFLYDKNIREGEWVQDALDLIQILKPAKSVLVAPPANELRQNDWPKLFYLAPRYFTLYLRYTYYFQVPQDLFHGPGLRRVTRLMRDGFSLLEQAIENHPAGRIDYAEINALLHALAERSLLPVQLGTARNLVPIVFLKLFKSDEGPAANPQFGVGKDNLRSIRDYALYWTEGLAALEGMYRHLLGDTDFLIRSVPLEAIEKITPEQLLDWTKEKNGVSRQAAESILLTAKQVKTIHPNNSPVVYIASGRPLNQYSFTHMAKIHLYRSINRLVMRAYAGDEANTDGITGLAKREIDELFTDFFPTLVDLGFLAPDNKSALSARVFEAGLFLYASNGDEFLSMNEALEIEAVGLSTHTKASQIQRSIGERCKSVNKDPRDEYLVDPECYRATFTSLASVFWDYVPGFSDFFQRQSADTKAKLLRKFDTFVREGSDDALYTVGDTQAYVLMPYYIEILFSRYDRNHDGSIDEEEAELAFPIYQPFLASKAASFGMTDRRDHHALFTYLLAYGKLPNESTLDKARYAWWRYVDEGDFEADRARILDIFAKLMGS